MATKSGKKKFRQWVKKVGGPRSASILIGCHESAIHYWLNGRSNPSLEMCGKILDAAKGYLKFSDLSELRNAD